MTVKEIAALAGVSLGTVDRVLHRRGRVSEATRDRVQRIIESSHFTPDPIARRFRRKRDYRFFALLPRADQDSGYWAQPLAGIERAAADFAGLGVRTEVRAFDRFNMEDFAAVSEAALSGDCDGVVFAPIRPEITSGFATVLTERGIPYVFLDTDLPGARPLCAIGPDSFRGGYLAGRLMRLFTADSERPFAVLDPHGEDFHIMRRRDGFLRYCGEHNIASVVREYSDTHGESFSDEDAALFLRENPDVAGVFVTNSLAHRLAEAFSSCGFRTQRPAIIGYDLIPRNRDLLAAGGIDAVISQHPQEQGRLAILALFHSVVLDKKVESRFEIPLDIYIRENVPEDV